MKKQIKTIALITAGLAVGAVIERLKKQQGKSKISSLYVGDIKDYKSFLDKF